MNHVSLDHQASDGRAALHMVSEDVENREPYEIVSLLLKYKADPNIQDIAGGWFFLLLIQNTHS
jgi:ankyrin repeat protein